MGRILHNHRRIDLSVPTLLDVLSTSRSLVPTGDYLELWRIVRLKIRQRTGVWLPRSITLLFASSNDAPPANLLYAVKSTIIQSHVPPPLRHYLCSVAELHPVSGKPVHDILCMTRRNLPWDRVVKLPQSKCDCSSVVGIRTVRGCVCTRELDEWHKLFGSKCAVLTQHMGNRTLAPWPSLKTKIQRASASIVRTTRMPSNVVKDCNWLLRQRIALKRRRLHRGHAPQNQRSPLLCVTDYSRGYTKAGRLKISSRAENIEGQNERHASSATTDITHK